MNNELKNCKRSMLVLALSAAVLTGCATNKAVQLTAPFDEQLAKTMLASGTNQLNGSALIRQNGGGIVTCAGKQVFLMPVTARAKEWARTVYGSETGGFFNVQNPGTTFDSSDKLFSNIKFTYCDAQGSFSFNDVADGTFYVFTRITWSAGSLGSQGGSIMRVAGLSGGKTTKVILSPE